MLNTEVGALESSWAQAFATIPICRNLRQRWLQLEVRLLLLALIQVLFDRLLLWQLIGWCENRRWRIQ